ncbi:MAG: tRNA pseudouridine(38-40) synthase TruA [Gammaproteobacteria bacterium]
MRIALGIAYQGTEYHGWQRQNALPNTVQETLEKALSIVANEPITVFCAGRTDKGVHATGQVVHFNTEVKRPHHAWVLGGNANLPKSISICWAKPMGFDFHARFKAHSRRYQYVIYNERVHPAIGFHQVTWYHRPLDVDKMQMAAQHLLGSHNFNAFRAASCQAKSPRRHIHHIHLKRQGSLVIMDIKADAFLHHMVRNIAGCLMAVGSGSQPPDWMEFVLQSQDRRCGGVTASPNGLYLVEVGYPEHFALPAFPATGLLWGS